MPPIHLAVDARPLSCQTTGIGRYLNELLVRLIPMTRSTVVWHLYSHGPLLVDYSDLPNIVSRTGRLTGGSVSTLWAQVVYPIWARQDHIDLFWSPRHHVPLRFLHPLKRVVTIHDLVWLKSPETMKRAGRFLESILMPRAVTVADRVMCVSRSTRDDLVAQFSTSDEKVSITPLGSCGKTAPSAKPAQWPYFLFVGTLEPRKNLPRLLSAFQQFKVQVDCPHYLKIIGGKGWGDQSLEAIVSQYGLENSVVLEGYVDDVRLHHYYQHASALLMPSLYEGFGLPLIEAMQYGVPVVASNLSSMPEVVGDGGLLIDPYNEKEITEAMSRLVEDSAFYNSLSNAALLQAKKFSWEQTASLTLSVFEQCLGVTLGAGVKGTLGTEGDG